MYLISIFFDDATTHQLQLYIDAVAKKTGNLYMTENQVKPHLTIATFHSKHEDEVVKCFTQTAQAIETAQTPSAEIIFAAVSAFSSNVICLSAVHNQILQELSAEMYKSISEISETKWGARYLPYQWMPHVTIGKHLSSEQMQEAFITLQQQFSLLRGKAVKLELAKTVVRKNVVPENVVLKNVASKTAAMEEDVSAQKERVILCSFKL